MKKSLMKVGFLMALSTMVFLLASCNNKEAQLQKEVEKAAKDCPITAAEGMTISQITYDKVNIIYACDVDETLYDVNTLIENKAKMKEAILGYFAQSGAADKDVKALIDLCVECRKGIVYRYVGTTTGTTCELGIGPDELKSVQ